jgi:hypothetical protein
MKRPYLSNFEVTLESDISDDRTQSIEDSDSGNIFGRTITESLEDTDSDTIIF